ncbi:hypothetical protein VSU01S_16460 [Vibrio superstes NBRC 103154]|uniref:Uncharacterized protein n=1 Tax=Vibrio superstes NBRC 103154 TaxID=1219062 RepID=A0A511QPZ0_9VIBR|nr:hypothetical protein VSU01S_16460 [Vibrio superstes NBRC 103154]
MHRSYPLSSPSASIGDLGTHKIRFPLKACGNDMFELLSLYPPSYTSAFIGDLGTHKIRFPLKACGNDNVRVT